MSEIRPFEARLARSWPAADWCDVSVVLAVSGGADSVAMLRGLDRLKTGGAGRLVVAHGNHQLRGKESEADEAFVAELAGSLGLPLETSRLPVSRQAAEEGDGMEAAARQVRYHFLLSVAQRVGARYVVTAHTADDQAETVLHRIVRGTGLSGLSGIPRVRVLDDATTLIRPLLPFRRSEVLEYLDQLRQAYRSDATNLDTCITRNRIRHKLLPQLADEYNPGVSEAIVRLATLAGEAQQVIDTMTESMLDECLESVRPECLKVRCQPLARRPRYLVRELLVQLWHRQGWPAQAMTFAHWDRLADLVEIDDNATAAETLPGNIAARREGHLLVVTPGPAGNR